MAIFEKENSTFQNGKYRQHLDRNWENGNKKLAAQDRRMAEMGRTDYPGSNEVTQARVGVDGTNHSSLNERLDGNELEVMNARKNYKNLSEREDAQDFDIETSKSRSSQAITLAQALASGSPKDAFKNEKELKDKYPSGADGTYLTKDNGHYWFYSKSEKMWQDLGVYQSVKVDSDEVDPIIADYNNYIKNSSFADSSELPSTNGNVKMEVITSAAKDWVHVMGNADNDDKKKYHGLIFSPQWLSPLTKSFTINIQSKNHATFNIDLQIHNRDNSEYKSYPLGKVTLLANVIKQLKYDFSVPTLYTNQYCQIYVDSFDFANNVDFMVNSPRLEDCLHSIKSGFLFSDETSPTPVGEVAISNSDNIDGKFIRIASGDSGGFQGLSWLVPYNATTAMTSGSLKYRTTVYNANTAVTHFKAKFTAYDSSWDPISFGVFKEFDVKPNTTKYIESEFKIQWDSRIYNVEIQLYSDDKIIADIAKDTSLEIIFPFEKGNTLLLDPLASGLTLGGAQYEASEYIGQSAIHIFGGTTSSVPSFYVPFKNIYNGKYTVKLKLASTQDANFNLYVRYKDKNGSTDLRQDFIANNLSFKIKANMPQEYSFVYDAQNIPSNVANLYITNPDYLDLYILEINVTPYAINEDNLNHQIGLPRVELIGDFASMTKYNSVIMQFKYTNGEQVVEGYSDTKWQGQSSLGFPAKNLKLKTYKDANLDKKLKFIGKPDMPKTHKHNLKINYVQPYQARNLVNSRLIAEIASTRGSLPAGLENSPMYGQIQGLPAECYINGEYYGLTSLNTAKDDDVWGLDDEATQFVFEGNDHSAAAQFNADDFVLDQDFTLEYPDEMTTVAHDTLVGAMQFIKNSDSLSDDDFKKQMPNYFDVASVIDWMIVIELIQYKDGMDKNICWNSYDGKTLVAVPYDVDSTWGLNFKPQTAEARLDANLLGTTTNKLLTVMLKRYPAEIKARWNALKGYGVVTIPHIQALFADYINNQIGEGALEKHWDKWEQTAPVEGVTDYNMLMRSIRIRVPHCDRYFNGLK